jgi:hypothetical protein
MAGRHKSAARVKAWGCHGAAHRWENIMHSRSRNAATALLASILALPASAGVFLNGVNIDGVTQQTFENCTVTIDDKGNVLITAKGYEVQAKPAEQPSKPSAAAEPVSKRYFLVSEQNVPGMTQYDVDVYVNSQWVKRIGTKDTQVILEISRFLRKGRNTVHFTAVKNLREPRASAAPAHFLKIHLGEGNVGGNNVTVGSLVEYVRTAAETRSFDDDFTLTAE